MSLVRARLVPWRSIVDTTKAQQGTSTEGFPSLERLKGCLYEAVETNGTTYGIVADVKVANDVLQIVNTEGKVVFGVFAQGHDETWRLADGVLHVTDFPIGAYSVSGVRPS